MKINKYKPFVFLYFFLNSVGLPIGLLYTTLLTPFFYIILIFKGKANIILWFFIFFSPFAIVHFILGTDVFAYIKSTVMLLTVYIFCYITYLFIKNYQHLETIFYQLLITNFVLTLIAWAFYFTALNSFFWTTLNISSGMNNFPRLSLLTYEPSYYSTLLVPLFTFYFLKFFYNTTPSNLLSFLMISLPMILSFSLGVIAALFVSIGIFIIFNLLSIKPKRKFLSFATIALISGLVLMILLWVLYPDNPIFQRINNVLIGADTSGKGRTTEAFMLAYRIAELKSTWFGVGLGQIKIVGDNIIRTFYKLPQGDISLAMRIPCVFAETLAMFGIMGAVIRLLVEVYLFFKCRVYENHFKMILFVFIFIYQFTGSFFTNVAELVIWILSFYSIFLEFNKTSNINTIRLSSKKAD